MEFLSRTNSSYVHLPTEKTGWSRGGTMAVAYGLIMFCVFDCYRWGVRGSDKSCLFTVKPLRSQVAFSSRADQVFSTESPLSDSTPNEHLLPTRSASTVINMEMELWIFQSIQPPLSSTGAGVSTSAHCLGLSAHILKTYGNGAICQNAVFELHMHYLI